jgi:uridine kinase
MKKMTDKKHSDTTNVSDELKSENISDQNKQGTVPGFKPSKNDDLKVRDFSDVCEKIELLSQNQESCLVAIDGNSGAGKSSLAGLLASAYDCNLFHMDDFFLQPEQRTPERLDAPGGNVDYERFKLEVLDNLNNGGEFSYRKYICRTGSFSDPVQVTPKKINIIEGSYSCHPFLSEAYHLKIFLKATPQIQRERILKRNGPQMLRRFLNEWIPMENKYFEAFDIEEKSDLIFRSFSLKS